ncbi:MAG: LD-carboxypeptidase [Bacteroidales bacterium]|jgi:muramoyltetrapeptide carboxypeptidase|nr:LD-carboxypeptidase [Bacteroidales bacterium]MDD3130308.1 LD-carboxypeptidase [Bacteroidales bacterium]NLO50225.1 LD-carboxypeptidase [Bacteroidales bacterium]
MITPAALKPNDVIGIVSPGKHIDAASIHRAATLISQLGYRVKTGARATGRHHYFSGTDAERARDFQLMLDDEQVKLILCSRGGYGSARIIDRLDFRRFAQKPKWIAGFSDITVFHSHLLRLFGVESLHATMPLDFGNDAQPGAPLLKMLEAAGGRQQHYEMEAHAHNRNGIVRATLTGGNLSVLCSLLSTPSDVDTTGKILFIEEVAESGYRIDRMMNTLLRADKLTRLAGLVVGGLTPVAGDDFGMSAAEIIAEAVAPFGYPVAFGFPAGHFHDNFPLIMGRTYQLEVAETTTLHSIANHAVFY